MLTFGLNRSTGCSRTIARFVQRLTRYVFATTAGAALIMGCTVQLARVEGHSMAPTLADHDRLVVDRLTYRIGKPTPGDIVMFHVPVAPDRLFVKRIIAQAGDVVRIEHGNVFVNGLRLDDHFIPDDFRSQEDWGPYRVPEDYYIVLGDHRNRSSDSRHWGPVRRDAIVGRVHARWWPLSTAAMF
jgi:signal peptidase I